MRRAYEFWMKKEGIGPLILRPLLFDVPLLRWTAEQDRHFRDMGTVDSQARSRSDAVESKVRVAIWHAAGRFIEWRRKTLNWARDKKPSLFSGEWCPSAWERAEMRRAFGLLRCAWLAHQAGRVDLCRLQIAKFHMEDLKLSGTALRVKAGSTYLAEMRRSHAGSLAHRGKPKKVADEIKKAIESNPDVSDAKIAKLVSSRPSRSTVYRVRRSLKK